MTKQRLIDANALLNKLDETIRGFETTLLRLKTREPSVYLNEGLIFAAIELVKFMKEFLEKAPTVERPKGEWILNEKESERHIELIYFCSACEVGEAWGDNERHNFCPECGADMRGEGE